MSRAPKDWDPIAFLLSRIRADPIPYAKRGQDPQGTIRTLLNALGNPQEGGQYVQIVGSKGKGSTALMLETLLKAQGLRVGTFTSPHLTHWCERIRIDGEPIESDQFADIMWAIQTAVNTQRSTHSVSNAGFFDILTAAALIAFKQASADIAIMEAGLGGRLDATTVVTPKLTCITSIELEHTDKLGTTLAAIAGEKAAVIRPGVDVVVGRLPSKALEVVDRIAAERGASCHRLGREINCTAQPRGAFHQDLVIGFRDRSTRTRLQIPGRYMADNAALALTAAWLVGAPENAGNGDADPLCRMTLPGRLQRLRCSPLILVDAAHTGASAAQLAVVLGQIQAHWLHLVLSFSAERNLDIVLRALLPHADSVTVTQADRLRSLSADRVAAHIRRLEPELPTQVERDPVLALRGTLDALPPRGVLCVAGSTYLAGVAQAALA